jgi:type VI secretion system secreted protein VgrG
VLTQSILAAFSSATRLYAIKIGESDADAFLVEAFVADDRLDGIGTREVFVLSTDAHVDLDRLLGQPATFTIRLADGSRTRFAGAISEAAMLGSDGGLARYRLRIAPWLWRLACVRHCRVWQERSVVEIVDDVFSSYQPQARWRWSLDATAFLATAPKRSYCCQYRESDKDFVRRLLTEEGLCWRVEHDDDGHQLVLFADSTLRSAVPDDATCAAEDGIRYHGARAAQDQDSVQALVVQRRLHASVSTVLSGDYKGRHIASASSSSLARKLPPLEDFDTPGQYAFANREQATRHADLRMQAHDARGQTWQGRSTVRTLRAGVRITVTDVPLPTPALTVLRVCSVGINNLPASVQQASTMALGPIPALLQSVLPDDLPAAFEQAMDQARETGYGNCFEAVPADLPWHQLPAVRPTARGSQSAIVIGADGSEWPNGADELYCDRLGRVRIRFHWQDNTSACWVRVAQRMAGAGMGSQFLPRIGQEVLVQFLENDIDRPIIVGALYNGRGEGGIAPTPGGRTDAAADRSLFAPAHDHARSGQGNHAGGNSPVWHGASADSDGHRNRSAQWGLRSKEFGGFGYNQLLFDDTDAQGRVQLRCTHAASSLELGHLIHAADNYRGSFRGLGAELRSDAYGAVKAGKGLLVLSHAIAHNASARDPVGENDAGVGLLRKAATLAEAFHAVALTHKTVGVAAHIGGAKASASVLDERSAPLKALLTSMSGSVDRDGARADATAADGSSERLPHPADPVISISAKNGFGAVAGQHLQLSNGEVVLLGSGQDMQFTVGGQVRWNAAQAVGVLGGAIKTGDEGLGLQLVSGKDAIDIQAQADTLKVQARDEVNVVSANAHIDWAAAKHIRLSTNDGASITIDAGNIIMSCPGKVNIFAGKKCLTPASALNYAMSAMPRGLLPFDEKFKVFDAVGDPVCNVRYSITRQDGGRFEGFTNSDGEITLQQGFSPEKLLITILGKHAK